MSYPDYPKNRLIVNGVDLTEKYKMVLVDGYTLKPPSPKTYTVDIPGGNGKLDLTESLIGDTTYDNRTQEFIFAFVDPEDFEKNKTLVSNFLHGKSYDYELTMDPGYTYNGRFKVTEYTHQNYSNHTIGSIKISIDSKPFKHLKTLEHTIDAIGGNSVVFESGRERVRPVITAEGYVKVIHDGKLVRLPQGTWQINDMLFTNGDNEVYFNTYDIKSIDWGHLRDTPVTWGEFGKKKLYEWYKTDPQGNILAIKWKECNLSWYVWWRGKNLFDKTNYEKLNAKLVDGELVSSSTSVTYLFKCESDKIYSVTRKMKDTLEDNVFSYALFDEKPVIGGSSQNGGESEDLLMDHMVIETEEDSEWIALYLLELNDELTEQQMAETILIEYDSIDVWSSLFDKKWSSEFSYNIDTVRETIHSTYEEYKDGKSWIDLMYKHEETKDVKPVNIKYEWGDL